MISRNDADALLSAAAGRRPSVGESLIFTMQGWAFSLPGFLGIFEDDPTEEGLWYNAVDNKLRVRVGSNVYESATWTLMP